MWIRYRMMELRGRDLYEGLPDRHRCLYIHIPKTAGLSIRKALNDERRGHLPYTEYLAANARKFRNYYKFAFVRNPWDRIASSFFFLKEGGLNEQDREFSDNVLRSYGTVDEFVVGWLTPEHADSWIHFRPQHHFICDGNGQCVVDFVGHFESLEKDFAHICSHLGLSATLEHHNRGTATSDYAGLFSPAARDRVAEVYQQDIETFGYHFPNERAE